MNSEIITLESDDDLNCSKTENGAGTATAAILNEKPLNINSLFGFPTPTLPVINYNTLQKSTPNGMCKSGVKQTKLKQDYKLQNGSAKSNGLQNSSSMSNRQTPKVQVIKVCSRNFDNIILPTTSAHNATNFAFSNNNMLSTSQSNSNKTSVPGFSVSLQAKIRRLTDTYVEASGGQQGTSDDEFLGQFKCTYNGCSKRLQNNVVFMYHVWAHVNRFKSFIEEPVTNLQITNNLGTLSQNTELVKNDVNRLMTCPECLLVQPTPHRMHLHYHRVHKPKKLLKATELIVCKTCESVYHVRSIAEHLARHGESDMPYHCRKCRYRVSSREAMFQHFREMHCGSNLLLCPFCLYSCTVPQTDRQRHTVVAKAYVQHVMDHDLEVQHGCGQCVTRFAKNAGVDLEARIENHLKQHKDVNERWKITKKSFYNLSLPQSKLVCSSSYPSICNECYSVLGSPRQQRRHFRDLKNCSIDNCDYETNCVHAMKMHSILSLCREINVLRWPFGRASVQQPPSDDTFQSNDVVSKLSAEKLVLECSGCGLTSTDGDAMCRHIVAASGIEPKVELSESDPEVNVNLASDRISSCANAVVFTKSVNKLDLYLEDNYCDTNKVNFKKLQLKTMECFGLDRMLDLNPVSDLIKLSDNLTNSLALPIKSEVNEFEENEETIEVKIDDHYSTDGVDEVTQKLANMLPTAKVAKVKENPLLIKYLVEPHVNGLEHAEYLLNLTLDIINFKNDKNVYPKIFLNNPDQKSFGFTKNGS